MRVSPRVGLTVAIAAFLIRADSLRAAPPATLVAATTPPSTQWIVHEVIPGELIGEVADRYAVSAASIARWNRIAPAARASAGERLRIQTHLPARQRDKLAYVVREGDSWASIARRYDVDAGTLETIWNPDVTELARGTRLTIWVEPGVVPKDDPVKPSVADLLVPVRKGAVSIGYPYGGALLRGVQIPPNPALYTVRNPERSYGSTHAIEVLQRGLAAFRLRTGFEGEVLLWDMSIKNGGGFGPHRSHRSGRDVDIALPLKAGLPSDTPRTNAAIDWNATWQLVRSMIDTGEVKYIFLSRGRQAMLYKTARADGSSQEELLDVMQYPRTAKYGIVRHSPGHHCHLHVRFVCGLDEPDCHD